MRSCCLLRSRLIGDRANLGLAQSHMNGARPLHNQKYRTVHRDDLLCLEWAQGRGIDNGRRSTLPAKFYTDAVSGTSADSLMATGLAEVLSTLLRQLGRDADRVTVRDCGGYYAIELPSDIELEDIERATPFVAGRGRPLIKGDGDGFPYDQERQRRDAYREKRNKLRLSPAVWKSYIANPNAEEFADIESLKPNPLLDLYICVSHFRATDAYNALIKQWEGGGVDGFRHNLTTLLDIFSHHPNNLAGVEKRWASGPVTDKPAFSLLQVINPSTGKGGNAPKANGLGVGNLDGFWLLEYLKFVGYFTIAAPVLIGDDRKTYVLHPKLVDLGVLHRLMDEFHESFHPSTPVKADILASLRFTRTFVRYRADLLRDAQPDPLLALFGYAPAVTDISPGFDLAFYKSMGNAFATMNLATINLPDWLGSIETEAQAQRMGGLLDEHITIISSIRTSKGDEAAEEFDLLRRYRDFLSGHDTVRFFEFAAHFSDYYLARRHRNQWVGQFTTEGMETLMAQGKDADKLAPILQNEGFKAIARAIRHATVIGQYYAARERGGYPFDVRYGLGQDLLRAAANPDTFITELSAFLQAYNAENARIDERLAKGSLTNAYRRPSVNTTHINDIVALVDQYGDSALICNMLVAYGYARDPKTQREDPQAAESASTEASPDED